MSSQNLAAASGTLAAARQTVITHQSEQKAIAQRVQNAATDSQSGWKGQGATATAQVVAQFMQNASRIDQALGVLADALGTTDRTYQDTEAEAAAGAQRIGASATEYRGLPV